MTKNELKTRIIGVLWILIYPLILFGTGLEGAERVSIGEWTVWSLSDGYLDIDQRMFVDILPEDMRQQLKKCHCESVSDLVVRTGVHCYLVDTGDQLILVDAGCGIKYGVATGQLVNSIREIGYDPDQIALVIITHLHPDHCGGLIKADGSCTFTNAQVVVSEIEATFWRDPVEEARAKAEDRFCYALAREVLKPYESRLRLIQPGESIIPGVTAVDASGHTPGHTAFLFHSNNEQLLLWGDLVHNAAVQFDHPEWYIVYDIDSSKAIEARKRLFAEAADNRLLVGGAHLSHSGLGYVLRVEEGFIWNQYGDDPFFHKIEISTVKSDSEKPEYLVHFKIDKAVASEVIAVTRPVLHCIEGEESIFSKSVNGNGYTVKALVYMAEGATKLKTSLEVNEGEVVAYSASDDCELEAYQHG